MPLSVLSNVTREAPLGSLLVAFLLGVAVAGRWSRRRTWRTGAFRRDVTRCREVMHGSEDGERKPDPSLATADLAGHTATY